MATMGVSNHGCGCAALRSSSYAVVASSSSSFSSSEAGAPTGSLWFASSLRRCSVVGYSPWKTYSSPVAISQRRELSQFQRKNDYHSSVGSCGFGASRQSSFPPTGFRHEKSSVDEVSKGMWAEEGLRLKYQKVREHICTHYGQVGLQNGGCKSTHGGEAYVTRGATNDGDNDASYHPSLAESRKYTCVTGGSIKSSLKNFEATDLHMQLKPSVPRLNVSQLENVELDVKKQSNFAKASINLLNTKDALSNRTSMDKQDNENLSKMTKPIEGTVEVGNQEKLANIFDRVLVVDNISTAKEVVQLLTSKYKNLIHACDTEVANIDVKMETPVSHGDIICFSIYSGPEADFIDGKSCIWVDVLDGGRNLLMEFASFFEDPNIKKVWHNYGFDCHVIEKYGIKLSGFHADTMHLARLWDSSRRVYGGYSLEALTSDLEVMSGAGDENKMPGANLCPDDELIMGKISMKSVFGKKKLKKDGSEGKLVTVAPVDVLQREERKPWICYSALDSISTLNLFNSLKAKLENMEWIFNGSRKGTMYDFYEKYWRPFGVLLAKMESYGMLVNRSYLSDMEKVAVAEKQVAAEKFRKWASKYCPDAKYMNVGSDTQIRQLFFGGAQNSKDKNEFLPEVKKFKVPNTENVIEEGKKTPLKYRTIELKRICDTIETDMYTASGWPSVGGVALKALAGKVSTDQIYLNDNEFDQNDLDEENIMVEAEESAYGSAYNAFGGGKEGKEACHAIAALCEVCSIDSLISNFLLPLQGNHFSSSNGRIHCSLNINTETGRLSARRPSLQNQPALEKDRYKIRQAFIAAPGNSLIVADYGQLELRILAHLANCKSMLDAFRAGGDFHSRTAMNMYEHIRRAVEEKKVLLEWHPQPGETEPPVPLLKDAFAAERRRAKTLNFSIAYGKTAIGLSRDWKVTEDEAYETVSRWYREREEVKRWQEERKKEALEKHRVWTLLGRSRVFPKVKARGAQKARVERAAINTPVQGSAADVAMCAMLEIERNAQLKELGWRLLLQVHDEVILEGPCESAEIAKAIVVECMSKPFNGENILRVDLAVDAKCAQNWYAAK